MKKRNFASLSLLFASAVLLGITAPNNVHASDQSSTTTTTSSKDNLANINSSVFNSTTSSTSSTSETATKLATNTSLVADGAGTVTKTDTGYELTNSRLKVDIGQYGEISGLYIVGDAYNTNYVMNSNTSSDYDNGVNEWVGELMFKTRASSADNWQKEYTANSGAERKVTLNNNSVVVTYTPSNSDDTENSVKNLKVTETYSLTANNELAWRINVKNVSNQALTIGDFGLPLPFNMYWGTKQRYEDSVLLHSFVGQNASYIYLNRPSGVGNFLAMTPDQDTGAGFEYKDNWDSGTGELSDAESAWAHKGDGGDWSDGLNVYYIHSAAIKDSKDSKNLGAGYLPHTSLTLASGQDKTYTFKFTASDLKNGTTQSSSNTSTTSSSSESTTNTSSETEASSSTSSTGDMTNTKYDDALKSILYKNNVLDAVSVPSMILQKDSTGKATGKMYLHTQLDPSQISFDFQNKRTDLIGNTSINVSDNNAIGNTDASAKYEKTTTYNGEKYLIYDISFSSLGQNNIIVNYTYNGQPLKTTLQYYVMDDPKTAIEKHAQWMVDNTLWKSGDMNGLFDDWSYEKQAKEGDYNNWGDDDGLTHGEFLALKNAIDPNKSQVEALDYYLDQGIWNNLMKNHHNDYKVPDYLNSSDSTGRGYAYPNIFNTYFQMYRIAKYYPNLINYKMSANDYLLRAYNIAKALYGNDIGYNYSTGLMGESTVEEMIDALKTEGDTSQATTLYGYMKKKYDGLSQEQYPYSSERRIDNTAEEAVYMLGDMFNNQNMMQMVDMKTRAFRGTQPIWYYYGNQETIDGENLMLFHYVAALADRGMDNWLRVQNNGLSTDQLGIAERANYAGKLANLSQINTGQISSEAANIGAGTWSYQAANGSAFYIPTWHGSPKATKLYDGWIGTGGESDLGFYGALQVASADISNDPVFGLVGYGANVTDNGTSYTVTPEDAARQKLNFIQTRLSYDLDFGGQYSKATVAKDGSTATFEYTNVAKDDHKQGLTITDPGNVMKGNYRVLYNGKQVSTFTANGQKEYDLNIPVSGDTGTIVITNTTSDDNNDNGNTTNNGEATPSGQITSSTSSSSNAATNSSSTTVSGNSTSSSSSTNAATTTNAAKKGAAVYATKKIYLYKDANFAKSSRLATYPKQTRTKRPMFVVTGYAYSKNGTLRYKVRDVNHSDKTAGKTGYITANSKFVVNVYYASVPKSQKIKLISKAGVNSYKNASLTSKVKHYKKGTVLEVKKVVKYHLATRYQLSNGHYITANKKLIIQE